MTFIILVTLLTLLLNSLCAASTTPPKTNGLPKNMDSAPVQIQNIISDKLPYKKLRSKDPRYSVVLPFHQPRDQTKSSEWNRPPPPTKKNNNESIANDNMWSAYDDIISAVVHNKRLSNVASKADRIIRYINSFGNKELYFDDGLNQKLQQYLMKMPKVKRQLKENDDSLCFVNLIERLLTKSQLLIVSSRRPNESVCGVQIENYRDVCDDPTAIERLCDRLTEYTSAVEATLSAELMKGQSTEPQKILRPRNAVPVEISPRFIYENAMIFIRYQMEAAKFNNILTSLQDERIRIGHMIVEKTYVPYQFLAALLQLVRYHHGSGLTDIKQWKDVAQNDKPNRFRTFVNAHSPIELGNEFWHFVSEFVLLLSEGCRTDSLTCAIESAAHSIKILEDGINLHFTTIPAAIKEPLGHLTSDIAQSNNFFGKRATSAVTDYAKLMPAFSKEATKAGAVMHAQKLFACALQLVDEATRFQSCFKGSGDCKHTLIVLVKEGDSRKPSHRTKIEQVPSNISNRKKSKLGNKNSTQNTKSQVAQMPFNSGNKLGSNSSLAASKKHEKIMDRYRENTSKNDQLKQSTATRRKSTAIVNETAQRLPSVPTANQPQTNGFDRLKAKQKKQKVSSNAEGKAKELSGERVYNNKLLMNHLFPSDSNKRTTSELSPTVENKNINWTQFNNYITRNLMLDFSEEKLKIVLNLINIVDQRVTFDDLKQHCVVHAYDYLMYGRLPTDEENESNKLFVKFVEQITRGNECHLLTFGAERPHVTVCDDTVEAKTHFFADFSPKVRTDICDRLHAVAKTISDALIAEIGGVSLSLTDEREAWLMWPHIVVPWLNAKPVVLTRSRINNNARMIMEWQESAVLINTKFVRNESSFHEENASISNKITLRTFVLFNYLPMYVQLLRYSRQHLIPKIPAEKVWYEFGFQLRSVAVNNPFAHSATRYIIEHSPSMTDDQWVSFWSYASSMMRIQHYNCHQTVFECASVTVLNSLKFLRASLTAHFDEIPQRISELLDQFKQDIQMLRFTHSKDFSAKYSKLTKSDFQLPKLSERAADAEMHATDLYDSTLQLLEHASRARDCLEDTCNREHELETLKTGNHESQ